MKNSDTAGHKGYDAGKKVSGIKRHIAVDTLIQLSPDQLQEMLDKAAEKAVLRAARTSGEQ